MAERRRGLKSEIWREVRHFTRATLITFFVLAEVFKVDAVTGFTVRNYVLKRRRGDLHRHARASH